MCGISPPPTLGQQIPMVFLTSTLQTVGSNDAKQHTWAQVTHFSSPLQSLWNSSPIRTLEDVPRCSFDLLSASLASTAGLGGRGGTWYESVFLLHFLWAVGGAHFIFIHIETLYSAYSFVYFSSSKAGQLNNYNESINVTSGDDAVIQPLKVLKLPNDCKLLSICLLQPGNGTFFSEAMIAQHKVKWPWMDTDMCAKLPL